MNNEQVYLESIAKAQKLAGKAYTHIESATELIDKAILAIQKAEYESTRAYAVLKTLSDKSYGYNAETNSAPYHLMEKAKAIRLTIQDFYDRYKTSEFLSDINALQNEAEEFEQETYDVEKEYLDGKVPDAEYYESRLEEIQEYEYDMLRGK